MYFNLDFNYAAYNHLCKALVASKKQVITVSEYFSSNHKEFIILRHDVDIFPQRALKMAIIESNYGIKSTYYFRMREYVFKKEIIKKIESLGHEVGYHYEVLADSKGDIELSRKKFRQNLDTFNKLSKVRTVSMHGSSLSRHNNLDIWKIIKISDFGLLGEAYLGINWNNLNYYTDAGGYWNSSANLRDKSISLNNDKPVIKSTEELIKRLNLKSNIYINVHPDRWNNGLLWFFEYISKIIRNSLKIAYHKILKLED